jgi:plastocyanin
MAESAPKGFGLSLAVAVIAVFLAVGAIAFAYVGASSQVTNLQGQVSTLQSQIPGLIAKSGLASVNATPATMAFRVDWCNTDNTGQDRFCPPVLIVHQGDLVQILFETNDTDAHTFTIVSAVVNGYNFQLNNTFGASGSSGNFSSTGNGMHNFLTNAYFQSSCVQASFSAASSGLSSSDCVSGTSLLQAGGTFRIPINPNPASVPLPPATPRQIMVDNMFHFVRENGSSNAVWSIASFRASIAGIFEYFCYYHVSNGMFGYLIVLPNTYCNTHSAACRSTSNTA